MQLKPGSKLSSAVCATEVIIVRAPADPVEICCGGAPMTEPGAGGEGSPDQAFSEGTAMGKRYEHEDLGLEVLCTKPGDGSLSIDGTTLPLKESKPLPSSD